MKNRFNLKIIAFVLVLTIGLAWIFWPKSAPPSANRLVCHVDGTMTVAAALPIDRKPTRIAMTLVFSVLLSASKEFVKKGSGRHVSSIP